MTLETAVQAGIDNAIAGMEGFELSQPYTTRAESALVAAKQAALLYSSLSSVANDIAETEEKDPTEDMAAAGFAREVERAVLSKHVTLSPYFHQAVTPIKGGHPIRFTFLSPHAAVQTSVFKASQIYHGSTSSRLRMWELMTVMEDSGRRGALIAKRPNLKSPDISNRAANNIRSWIDQLTEEGDRRNIIVMDAETTEAAADQLLSFAGSKY